MMSCSWCHCAYALRTSCMSIKADKTEFLVLVNAREKLILHSVPEKLNRKNVKICNNEAIFFSIKRRPSSKIFLKSGLHKLQQQVEWGVFLFSCSRATLLTWIAQRRHSKSVRSSRMTLLTWSAQWRRSTVQSN